MRDPYEVLGVPRGALRRSRVPIASSPRSTTRTTTRTIRRRLRASRSTRPTRSSARTSASSSIAARSTPRASRASRVFPAATRAAAPVEPVASSPTASAPAAVPGWRAGGAGFEDILNSMFALCGRTSGPGSRTFEFDTGGIGLDLDLNVAMTVSLEESVRAGKNASACRPARSSTSGSRQASPPASRSG